MRVSTLHLARSFQAAVFTQTGRAPNARLWWLQDGSREDDGRKCPGRQFDAGALASARA